MKATCVLGAVPLLRANDMRNFIVLSENPFKIRKIAFYSFLTSLLGPELLMFKYLEDD